MYVIRLDEDAPIIDKSLRELAPGNNGLEYRAVAITRHAHTIVPSGDDRFEVGDLVYVISSKAGLKELYKYSGKKQFEVRDIMILGGSRIGMKTADSLGKQHYVKLIELNRERSFKLSNRLSNTLVIHGDGTDMELLKRQKKL